MSDTTARPYDPLGLELLKLEQLAIHLQQELEETGGIPPVLPVLAEHVVEQLQAIRVCYLRKVAAMPPGGAR
jgi:hypothetical protein